MKCPVCESEMQSGGLITSSRGRFISWLPKDSFEENRSFMRALTDGKTIKVETKFFALMLSGQVKIPNAFYCEKCNKIVGIFDIEE